MLGVGEEAAAKATGKRPTASNRRQAIFTLSDDDTEDADIFQLVPQNRRRQLETTEQGGSSVLVGLASSTTTVQRTSGKGVEHQAPVPVLVVKRDPVAPEETRLRHIIPCFQAVSICNLDVSLQFILNTVVF